jgi:hypothetical protein
MLAEKHKDKQFEQNPFSDFRKMFGKKISADVC